MKPSAGACGRIMVLLVALLTAAAAVAQLQPIPELPITLDGQVGAGYAGGSGTGSGISSGVFFNTNATLEGYYHDPRFLKFDVQPSFRWNSNSDSFTAGSHDNTEGVFSRASFLDGSWMPIGFQYSFQRTNFSTLSNGLTPITLSSTGDSQNFGVNWSVRRPSYPSLGVNYSWGSSSADYTGLTDSGSNSSHSSLSLNSSYSLLGFHVGGAYSESRSQEHTPDLLNLGLPTTGTTDMKAENVTIQRALPLNTQLSAQYSHTDDNYNLFNTPQNEMFDIATASLVSNPIKRLTLSGSVSYNSNLSAQILSQVASSVAGGTGTGVTTTTAGQSLLSTGRSLGFNENASYDVGHGLYVLASASHETSHVTGSEDLYTDEYLGGLSYSRALFGGTLGLSYTPGYEVFRVGGSVLVLDQSGSVVPVTMTSRGMIQAGSASYSRHLGRWQAQGTFNYSQSDVNATFLSAFLSRSISGTIRATTRLRNQWNLTVNAMASDGTVPGLSGNRTEMFGGQISNRTWSLSVQDQLNSGYSVLTAAGITSVSLPAIASGLLPNETLTDSSGLSVSISYRRRALSVVSTFTDSSAKLHAVAGPIDTGSKNFDNRVIYRFRKVDIQGGYRWYSQMASSNGLLNQSYQTYWIGIVRQFHAF